MGRAHGNPALMDKGILVIRDLPGFGYAGT